MESPPISNLAIELDCRKRINISLLHSRLESLVPELRILNRSNETLRNVAVILHCPQFADRWFLDFIEELKPGAERLYSNLTPSPILFHRLFFDSPFATCIEIYLNDELRISRPIEILPINSWDQAAGHELALASFVFYLSEEISSIVRRAQQQPELITKGLGFPDLRPVDAAKALHNTLKEFCPPYAHELGTIGRADQLIRLPKRFMSDWRGTCIDLALIIAAAIENIRCYPVIFILQMRKGGRHALAGLWNLRDPHVELPNWDINYPIPGSIITDKKKLMDLIDAELLIPLDPDAIRRKHDSFERCVSDAINLIRDNALCSMQDIESARQFHRLYPLPVSTSPSPTLSLGPARNPARRPSWHVPVETDEAPPELLQSLARGKCVLFIGDKLLSPNGTDGPLPKTQLTERLARSCGYDGTDKGLHQVAQYYENKFGRDKLVKEAQESLHDSRWVSPKIFQLIAQLPLELVVCFYYDTMLEAALTRRKVGFARIFKDEQISQITADKVTLVKLYGCAEAGEPLVLTSHDQLDLFHRKPVLSKFVKAHIANQELLLLGCDLDDFTFKQLYRSATQHLSFLTHRAFALTQADATSLHYWHQQDMVTIRADPESFLTHMIDALPKVITAPPPRASPAAALARPYKFLDYFNTEDEAIFFGREREIDEFYKELISSRGVTILCGKSGDGKTSLIKAGVIPMLRREHDWLVAYTRCGLDAEQSIKQEVSSVLIEAGIRIEHAPEDLAEFLRHVSEQTRQEVIIVIDQFEEFFIKLGIQAQIAFFEKLSKCIYDISIASRFIIVIREDYLPNLTEPAFTDRLVLLPRYLYRLPELSRQGAFRAIVEPARKFGLSYEPELPDSILDDLSPDTIIPAQLQIVCSKLNDALGRGELFSRELYEELGRSRRILEDHLNEAIIQFNDADAENVRSILKALVTSEATKDLLTLSQVVERACLAVKTTKQLLHHLIHQHRLVREVVGSELQYELSHECLAPAISAWLAEKERRLREVQELLGREIANLHKFPDFTIESEKLKIINEWSSQLVLSDDGRLLILVSILHHQSYEMLDAYWIEQSEFLSLAPTYALLNRLFQVSLNELGETQRESLQLLRGTLSETKGPELLEHEVANWRNSPDVFIKPALLRFLLPNSLGLVLSDDARFLILRSIIQHQAHDLLDHFWLKQIEALTARQRDILIEDGTKSLAKGVKKNSAAPLNQLREALLVKKIQDQLNREVARSQMSPNTVIERKLLRLIHKWSPKLNLSDDARLLVLSNIIRYRSYKMLDWFWMRQLDLVSPVKYGSVADEAQKLLDREVARWAKSTEFPLEPAKLMVIHSCYSRLNLSAAARVLILSSLLHNKSYELLDHYWIEQFKSLTLPVRYVNEMLQEAQKLLDCKDGDHLLKITEFVLIRLCYQRLNLDTESKAFILSSMLHHKAFDMLDGFWLEQAKLLPLELAQMLLNSLLQLPPAGLNESGSKALPFLQEALMTSKVQNFLEREVANWRRSPDKLVEPVLLKFIHQWAPKLALTDDARLLILSSILRHRTYELLDDFWLEQASASKQAPALSEVVSRILEQKAKGKLL